MLGSHDYDKGETIPYGKVYVAKNVVIGDFVWFGSNCSTCGNVTIGEGAVVANGAVFVKDVSPYARVGGTQPRLSSFVIEHPGIV